MSAPTPTRQTALEADVAALTKAQAAMQATLEDLAHDVRETIRVTGCMDPRNRELDDWLRRFATLHQSDDAKGERAALSAMLRDWQDSIRIKKTASEEEKERRERRRDIQIGIAALVGMIAVAQFVGGWIVEFVRTVAGGAQ